MPNFDRNMNPARKIIWLSCLWFAGCGAAATVPPVAKLPGTLAARPAVDSKTALQKDGSQQPETKPPANASIRYTVRKTITPAAKPTIPRVLLSAGHAKLCTVKVGEVFPKLVLPRLGSSATDLASLYGKQATVVLFWHPDRWMARTALIDMQRDVASQFATEQVAVVGIAVRQPAGAVQAALGQTKAAFPQLLDVDGQAFAKVGTVALPRLYVLDQAGKIVWFDIEYSEGSRRELWQTLKLLASK